MKDNCGNFNNDRAPDIDASLPSGVKDLLAKAHPDVRKALVDLRKYDAKVLAAFKENPELAAKFVADPGSVLAAIGVPLDSQLRTRLKAVSLQPSFLKPRAFCLPNGKTINAKVQVSIAGSSNAREVARK